MSSIQRVTQVLASLGASEEGADEVAAWVDTVATWNQRMDLTAARNDDELVDLMVADAAVLARTLASDAARTSAEAPRVVDVGSGAGAPGLPLALLRRDLHLTLVEPLQKRATLLRLAKGRHREAHLQVVQDKGAALVGGTPFDVAISRATLPPPKWLELGTQLAPRVWVLLAKHEPPQKEAWKVVHDERYVWPLTGAERRLVGYETTSS